MTVYILSDCFTDCLTDGEPINLLIKILASSKVYSRDTTIKALGRILISCSTFCLTHQEEVAFALLLQHVDGSLGHLRQGRDVQIVLPFEILVLEVIVGEQT